MVCMTAESAFIPHFFEMPDFPAQFIAVFDEHLTELGAGRYGIDRISSLQSLSDLLKQTMLLRRRKTSCASCVSGYRTLVKLLNYLVKPFVSNSRRAIGSLEALSRSCISRTLLLFSCGCSPYLKMPKNITPYPHHAEKATGECSCLSRAISFRVRI